MERKSVRYEVPIRFATTSRGQRFSLDLPHGARCLGAAESEGKLFLDVDEPTSAAGKFVQHFYFRKAERKGRPKSSFLGHEVLIDTLTIDGERLHLYRDPSKG